MSKHGHHMLESAMREVHRNIPSTVRRAKVKGKKKEAMLRAIAFSKVRKGNKTAKSKKMSVAITKGKKTYGTG